MNAPSSTIEVDQGVLLSEIICVALSGDGWERRYHSQFPLYLAKAQLIPHYGLTIDYGLMFDWSDDLSVGSVIVTMDVNTQWTKPVSLQRINDLHASCPIPGNISRQTDEHGHPFLRHLQYHHFPHDEDMPIEYLGVSMAAAVEYSKELCGGVLKAIREWFTGPIDKFEARRIIAERTLALYPVAGGRC